MLLESFAKLTHQERLRLQHLLKRIEPGTLVVLDEKEPVIHEIVKPCGKKLYLFVFSESATFVE